jgi:predicted RNA-binding Zn-ribbon protein involved in translation (DUF1610 family)
MNSQTQSKFSTARVLAKNHSLREIKRDTKLGCSLETIARRLAASLTPLRIKRLVLFSCISCSRDIQVLQIFYRRQHSYSCPECGNQLKRKSSLWLPFYNPERDVLCDMGGKLICTSSDLFKQRALPLLRVPPSSAPLFALSYLGGESYYHILRSADHDTLMYLCSPRTVTLQKQRIVSGLTRHIAVDAICNMCMDIYIRSINGIKSKKVRSQSLSQIRREKALKLFIDAKAMGSISQACFHNDVSRMSFYRNKINYPDMYQQVFNIQE